MTAKSPSPFAWAVETFAHARNASAGKPLQNNTRLYQRSTDCYAVRLHRTDVVTLWADGRVTLDSGGWQTVTTKDRMTGYAPVVVSSDRGVWYVAHERERARAERRARREYGLPATGSLWEVTPDGFPYREFYRRQDELSRVPYFDGITFDARGRCTNGITPVQWARYLRERADMDKRIQTYCTGFNRTLAREGLPMPSGGDCWYCSMSVASASEGEPLGDATNNPDHLLGHMDESYYVPSLAVNALRAKGYQDAAVYHLLYMNAETGRMAGPDSRYQAKDGSMGGNMVRRALLAYLRDRLLPVTPSPNVAQRAPVCTVNDPRYAQED